MLILARKGKKLLMNSSIIESNMLIRRYEDKDKPSILNLGQNFELTPYVVDKKFRNLTSCRIPLLVDRQLANPQIVTLVACEGDKVIAFLSYMVERDLSEYHQKKINSSPLCASILFVTVDKEFRGKNIATTLIEQCFKECRKLRVTVIRVGTDFDNQNALSLYQKLDFEIVLTWYIYRIYKDEFKPLMSSPSFIPIKSKLSIEATEKTIARRPLPWFYEPKLNTEHTYQYLASKKEQKLNSLQIYQAECHQKKIGFTLKRDSLRESYYKIKGSLWNMEDLVESEIRGQILPIYIKQVIKNLPDFLMLESWVCAHDYETQHILKQVGMKAVYGGISLRRDI